MGVRKLKVRSKPWYWSNISKAGFACAQQTDTLPDVNGPFEKSHSSYNDVSVHHSSQTTNWTLFFKNYEIIFDGGRFIIGILFTLLIWNNMREL